MFEWAELTKLHISAPVLPVSFLSWSYNWPFRPRLPDQGQTRVVENAALVWSLGSGSPSPASTAPQRKESPPVVGG